MSDKQRIAIQRTIEFLKKRGVADPERTATELVLNLSVWAPGDE